MFTRNISTFSRVRAPSLPSTRKVNIYKGLPRKACIYRLSGAFLFAYFESIIFNSKQFFQKNLSYIVMKLGSIFLLHLRDLILFLVTVDALHHCIRLPTAGSHDNCVRHSDGVGCCRIVVPEAVEWEFFNFHRFCQKY